MNWNLLEGTTIENAAQDGAMWIRKRGDGSAEMIQLPGYVIANLGYIPRPEIARTIVGIMEAGR